MYVYGGCLSVCLSVYVYVCMYVSVQILNHLTYTIFGMNVMQAEVTQRLVCLNSCSQ
jgi:hypothetical protein